MRLIADLPKKYKADEQEQEIVGFWQSDKFSGYDYKFVMGDGEHNGKHGGSIFPDMLRWLWRDYPKH